MNKTEVMIRIFKISIAIISIVLTAGCASVSKAPAGQSQDAKSFNVPEGKGTVYLYRTGRVVGAAGQLSVKVNGKDAGGTGPGTFFRWDLNPGIHTFSSSTAESSATVQIDVKAGEMYFIRQDARLGIDNGRVTMKEVDAHKGMREVNDCRLLVSAYIPE